MEQKIRIRDVDINYVQVGQGEHAILLLPGTMGTIWTNYKPQVENLDRKLFTIVAWDPPGNGNSRPPNRTSFPEDYLQEDATYAKDLMNALGHKTFSVLGWCNGGRTASVLASMYPEAVRKLITVATNCRILPKELELYKNINDPSSWPERITRELYEIYPKDYVKIIWESWFKWLVDVAENRDSQIFTHLLETIQCPTLIVHGDKDGLLDPSHAQFMAEGIPNSRAEIFEDGPHNLHLKYSEKFNNLVTTFLTSS